MHAHRAAIAGVDALDLTGHKAVGDIGDARATMVRRQGQAEQSELAHLIENEAIRLFLGVRFDNSRAQPVFRKGMRGLLDQALFVTELLVQQKRIGPIERRRLLRSCFG